MIADKNIPQHIGESLETVRLEIKQIDVASDDYLVKDDPSKQYSEITTSPKLSLSIQIKNTSTDSVPLRSTPKVTVSNKGVGTLLATIEILDTDEKNVQVESQVNLNNQPTLNTSASGLPYIVSKRSIPAMDRERVFSDANVNMQNVNTTLRVEGITLQGILNRMQVDKFGVENLINIAKPAKCCRKSILNERSQSSIPYPPSLLSLPLDHRDIRQIEKKIKMRGKDNTNEYTASYAKMEYYVNLGSVDSKKKSWSAPTYKVMYFEVKREKYVTESHHTEMDSKVVSPWPSPQYDVRIFGRKKKTDDQTLDSQATRHSAAPANSIDTYQQPAKSIWNNGIKMSGSQPKSSKQKAKNMKGYQDFNVKPQMFKNSIDLSSQPWAPFKISDISLPRDRIPLKETEEPPSANDSVSPKILLDHITPDETEEEDSSGNVTCPPGGAALCICLIVTYVLEIEKTILNKSCSKFSIM